MQSHFWELRLSMVGAKILVRLLSGIVNIEQMGYI
jgi:hypothetical protein